MADDLVRLVVRGQGRRVETLLARGMTVLEAAGSLAGIAGLLQDGSVPPFTWRLVTAGGRLLEPERSLAEEGVRDGQELILVAVDETIDPPEVDGVVTRVARSQGKVFDASTRLALCSVAATLALAWWSAMIAATGGLRSLTMPVVAIVVSLSAIVVQSKALRNLLGARLLALVSVVPFGEAGIVLGRRLGGGQPEETVAVAIGGAIVIGAVAIGWALPRSSWITLGYVALGLPPLIAGVVVEALGDSLVDLVSGSLLIWSFLLVVLSGIARHDSSSPSQPTAMMRRGAVLDLAAAGNGRRHVEREQVLGMTIGALVGMAACWFQVLLRPSPTDVGATAVSVVAVVVTLVRAPNAGQTLASAASLLLGGAVVVIGIERTAARDGAGEAAAVVLGVIVSAVMLAIGYWAGRTGDFRPVGKASDGEFPEERWVPPPGVLSPVDPTADREG